MTNSILHRSIIALALLSSTGIAHAETAPQPGWWTIFHSEKLDAVMRQAVGDNLDLAAADATIRQANEAIIVARAGLRPRIDLTAQGGRQHVGGVSSNIYAIGPQVSFDFDIFGGTKRAIEQQGDFADLQKHRFDAAWLTLTGDIATRALQLASARAQIAAVESLLAQDRRRLELTQRGRQYGSISQIDVALAQSQLAQDETLLPPLAQQRDVARHALSVLVSKAPADWTPPDFDLADFTLPGDPPMTLPSDLAHDRPDILEAEAQLHAASAGIGMATADLYPRLQLSASLAEGPPGIATLWSIAAGLTAPIFHGGALKANQRAALDGYQASLASYKQTVVASLGQVADTLHASAHDSESDAAQQRALAAAENSLRLTESGYRAGQIDLLAVLDAQRARQRALLGQIQANTARYIDAVNLSVALGGHERGAFENRVALTR
ncbi:MAG: efflux transporter outer membrane subunit [Sphingomonadales bacterium]|nr:efflux transporter outer membrane subunit [Sphingomonadales bacterium]MDE2170736.1 efflux transporter outer membrane subunit [Sphingomonadales bacterium]